MIHKRGKFTAFTDGVMSSYRVVDRRLIEPKQDVIHFAITTVGERRYWDAQVAGTVVSMAVLVPYESNVDRGDVVLIDGKQYTVEQKDYKDRLLPPCWLLSLAETGIGYNVKKGGT